MIEQKVINKNGKVFTKIKTSKNIKYNVQCIHAIENLFSGRKRIR